MENDELIDSAISMIDEVITIIDSDYSEIGKATRFKKELLNHKSQLLGCRDREKIHMIIGTLVSEVQQFNLWIKVETVSRALKKKKGY